MIESLDKLTIGRFIDLLCGDKDVLLSKHEKVSDTRLAIALRNIVFEYREIADPSGAKAYISDVEDLLKAKVSVSLFTVCSNIANMGETDKAKEILEAYGINTKGMSESRLKAEIKSNLERAKYEISRHESDESKQLNIRKDFDEQTATLMAYFKFQIDTSTMMATIYAHLVAKYNREIKIQLQAMKKR